MKRITNIVLISLAACLDGCNMFLPVDALVPQVSEVTIVEVSNNQVRVSAQVSDPDAKNSRQEKKSGKIKDFGFVYGILDEPTIENGYVEQGGETITASPYNWEDRITRLSSDETYYIRVYAVNEGGGITYGPVTSFKASEPSIMQDTTFIMNFSNTYDLETGHLQSQDGTEDMYWYPYGQPAGIYPRNGAKFFVMPTGTDFKALKYSDLTGLKYTADFVNGSYTTRENKLFNGTVLAYVTNEGHFGKMRINSKGMERNDLDVYSGNMGVSITTYTSN
ncbi:hypothetical protein DYBT9623_04987 [Dyadobacter sp. CECT 9623]|uniref:Fibronectin type-III domain-containing protein n=1 Tax=Dyadobacter linearis TaxID=2823330 RepID=A0ABM8UXI4_9BACT|nr:hypothetical protein [Dyadobacter sp. CECT 9623]CAG5074214.1 hypothetical protein DYBT9623_04987 [Dyadobacter sp. CECT 9623]